MFVIPKQAKPALLPCVLWLSLDTRVVSLNNTFCDALLSCVPSKPQLGMAVAWYVKAGVLNDHLLAVR